MDFNLPQRYALASLPVILVLTIFLGWWVNRAIERQVIDNTAANVALYVQSFLSPELQGLAEHDRLTAQEVRRIEDLLTDTPLGKKIQSVKIWKEGGLVVYYSRAALIGQRFEPTENLRRAWQGQVAAEFDDLREREDAEEAKLGVALLEIYSPVRAHGKDRIIAVAEFYQEADALAEQLAATRTRTWLLVSASTLVAYGLLYGIVHAGGRLIRRQRQALSDQVEQLSLLLIDNRELGERLKLSVRRTAELHEKLLRRVSADLHDGPAQSLSLALLRLDALLPVLASGHGGDAQPLVDEIRAALQEGLTELRYISRGLGLPDLDNLGLGETIERAIAAHERRTHTEVASALDRAGLEEPVSVIVKLTAYRTVQEALMNAFRHAQGQNQQVEARSANGNLLLTISDKGPGFEFEDAMQRADRLGLIGLRERIESLGGELAVTSVAASGTTLHVKLPMRSES